MMVIGDGNNDGARRGYTFMMVVVMEVTAAKWW